LLLLPQQLPLLIAVLIPQVPQGSFMQSLLPQQRSALLIA
jgi:hypothetical protein